MSDESEFHKAVGKILRRGKVKKILEPNSYGTPEAAAEYQARWLYDFMNSQPCPRMACDDPFSTSPTWRR